MRKIPEQRFQEKIATPDTCLEWTGYRNADGYGRFYLENKKIVYAHRYAWTLEHGEIPEGMCVLHHCDNPGCVNVKHLFLGTLQDNMDDKVRKNRQSKNKSTIGVTIPNDIVLSAIGVYEETSFTQEEIAEMIRRLGYSVTRSSISCWRSGKQRKHLRNIQSA